MSRARRSSKKKKQTLGECLVQAARAKRKAGVSDKELAERKKAIEEIEEAYDRAQWVSREALDTQFTI